MTLTSTTNVHAIVSTQLMSLPGIEPRLYSLHACASNKEARRNSVLKPDAHNSQGGTPARIKTVLRVTTLLRLLQGIISQEDTSVNTHNHSRAYPCELATGIIWTTTTHVWQKHAPRGPTKCPWWKHNRAPTANKRHPCPEPTHLHVPTNETTRRQCNA